MQFNDIHFQTLMSVQLTLTTALRMQFVPTRLEASTVHVLRDGWTIALQSWKWADNA